MDHDHPFGRWERFPQVLGLVSSGFRAAAAPWERSWAKPLSSRTGTPRLSALSALLPGASPTTTYDVLLETEPVTLPPSAWTAAAAPSRLQPSRVPVITTVTPSSSRGPRSTASSAIRTPAAAHLSTTAARHGSWNHSSTASAITGPTPSTAA